ncbi:apolipoprotein N-acyltransferase [Devosia sp. MC532]|uniref:apolipoprotein N-acyltransferase n=1 Tax=Devosia sp. MC532 TaxID=2799788 RepID=UPI0018F35064|nr:apolipoprotein N-acyltransferase [Devosia sp. MC532]MBJ7577275.1 apolipoprotein N-acyltransferase [Devosia sp. MC532]
MTWLAETTMLSQGWRRFLILLLAGLVAGLSVPPFFLLPALFVAMPIWIWALDGAERGKGLKRIFGPAFSIGFAFGLGYFLVSFHWLGAAFFVDGGWFVAAMPFAILALSALIALFWGLASAFAHMSWSHGGTRIFTLAGWLAAAEFARGHVLTGFPFDLLGYSLTATEELMQASSLVGVYGLSFIAPLIAATPALIWPADDRNWSRRLAPFVGAIFIVASMLGYGWNRLNTTPVTERTDMHMRLVQPLVFEHSDFGNVDPVALIDRLTMLSEMRMDPIDQGLADITHLVWPESSLPFYLEAYPEALTRIARLLPPQASLITGAPRRPYALDAVDASGKPYNSVIVVDTEGEIVSSYDKSHLVPFGEYLPFDELLAKIGVQQFVPGSDGWAAGDAKRRLMTLPGGINALVLICYEILFSGDLGEAANAGFLLNVTNDAWFDASYGPSQHAHHARIRAVEEGMSLIRVANTGLTYATDPLGRITARLAPGEMGALDVRPHERLDSTLFAQLRHWPFLLAVLGSILAGFVAHVRIRRQRLI